MVDEKAHTMLMDVIKTLDSVQHGMPTTSIEAFLLVASHPDIDLTGIAKQMKLEKETAAKIINRLKEAPGDSGTKGVSLGLIRVREQVGRRKPLELTPKGRRLYAKLLNTFAPKQAE